MIGKKNLKKLDMIYGKNARSISRQVYISSLKYLMLLGAIFFTTFSCNIPEKSSKTIQIERLVLNKNNLNNGYISVDTIFIKRNKREDSALDPLVGVKSFWKDNYIYSPYYFSDDAGLIWILPYNFFIDLKDIHDTDVNTVFLSKYFKLTLILGTKNEDYNIFIDNDTKMVVYQRGSVSKKLISP